MSFGALDRLTEGRRELFPIITFQEVVLVLFCGHMGVVAQLCPPRIHIVNPCG